MKRVLVTGGFGFLGSYVLEQLLENDETDVFVVDNLASNPLPLDFLMSQFLDRDRVEFEICSVQDFCGRQPSRPFDEIYHLASVVGPAGVLGHAGTIAKSIIDDAMSLAELSEGNNSRLLFVSTSEVYGGGQKGLCSEEMPSTISVTPSARLEYAVGKLASEVAMLNFHRAGRLDVRIVRPFNVSGPRQSGRGGFVLPRFIGQAMDGLDLTVFGKGQQLRAFTHAEDVARGLVASVERGKSGEIYNLGNPENKCSIEVLAQEVIEITGSKSKIRFVDPRDIYGNLFQEANDKFPESSKARIEIGWEPQHDRQSTIKSTFEFMKALPGSILKDLRGF